MTQAAARSAQSHHWWKYALWTVLGLATLSVTFYSEIPLLHQARERAYLRTMPWLIIPHVIAGVTALISGPLQFSSRLRRRFPAFHRVLGRVYVCAVFVAAPLAVFLARHNPNPLAIEFTFASTFQAAAWATTTAVAFLAARNRYIPQHREWMVRSYAVTFTFVGTRVLQPIPAWNHLGRIRFAAAIIFITYIAVFTPEIAACLRWLITRLARTRMQRKPLQRVAPKAGDLL
jgi:uncharacterized membrane protein